MRIFGSDRMDGMLQKLGLKEDEAIVHPWINKALEKAQQKVEARNFDIRKNILKYDNVMNDQRKVDLRAAPRLDGARRCVRETIADMRHDVDRRPRRRATSRTTPMPSSGTSRACSEACREHPQPRSADRRLGEGRRHRRRGDARAHAQGGRRGLRRRASRRTRPTSCARSRSRCCCRRSTISGASTSSRSTICAR